MIYTMGYSQRTPAELPPLMAKLKIDLLVDVRAKPYARFKPEFNKKKLEELLGDKYIWKGDVLGGPGGGGEVTKTGLAWLRKQEKDGKRLLLLCVEYAPGDCHRHQIAVELAPAIDVIHVYEGVGISAAELERGIAAKSDTYATMKL